MKDFDRTILISIQMACKTYPGGISAVAHALEMNPTMLANKLNPECERNVLSFDEAIKIMLLIPCQQTFALLAFHMGKGLYELPVSEPSNDPLGDTINALQAITEVITQVKQAQDKNSDGGMEITPKEARAIRPHAINGIQCLGNVISYL